MKKPHFHYIYTEDTGLIELYANNELLAEWACADSEYIEDEVRQFQAIYEKGMAFAVSQTTKECEAYISILNGIYESGIALHEHEDRLRTVLGLTP